MKTHGMTCMECGEYSTACGCTVNNKVEVGSGTGQWECSGQCTDGEPSLLNGEGDPATAGETTAKDFRGQGSPTRHNVKERTGDPVWVAPNGPVPTGYTRVAKGIHAPLPTPEVPVYDCASRTLVNDQLRCGPSPQPAPPPPMNNQQKAFAQFKDVVPDATMTASASFYAPIQVHHLSHLEDGEDVVVSYFTRATLPYLLPGNDTTLRIQTPTTEPQAPTAEPQAPLAEPQAPTKEPQAPTTEPQTALAEPQAPLAEPQAPTKEPQAPTTEPQAPTKEPQTPTTEPQAPTREPQAPTTEPQTPTEAPTAAPPAPTAAPHAPTAAPPSPIAAPQAPVGALVRHAFSFPNRSAPTAAPSLHQRIQAFPSMSVSVPIFRIPSTLVL